MKKLKVLCCDDNPLHLKIIEKTVEQAGHTPTCCESAKMALDLDLDQNFDAYITDYVMDDMNGLEFTQIIKKANPKALVIIISDKNPLLEEFNFDIDDRIKIAFKGKETKETIKIFLHQFHAQALYDKNGSYRVV